MVARPSREDKRKARRGYNVSHIRASPTADSVRLYSHLLDMILGRWIGLGTDALSLPKLPSSVLALTKDLTKLFYSHAKRMFLLNFGEETLNNA